MAAVSSGTCIFITVHVSFNTVDDGVTIPLQNVHVKIFHLLTSWCSTAGGFIAMVHDKTIFIIYTGFILGLTECCTLYLYECLKLHFSSWSSS